MNVGDPVKCVGRVKEIIDPSAMVQTDDQPGNPGREIWFKQTELQPNETVAAAVAAAATEGSGSDNVQPVDPHRLRDVAEAKAVHKAHSS